MDEEDESELLTLQMEVEGIDKKIKSIGNQINELLSKQEHLNEKKERIVKKIGDLEKHGSQHSTNIKEWNSDLFPWSDELLGTLMQYFNISKFRPLQKEAMNVTLSKEDCILIMPTGGGKSLTFQLPALLSNGFTLVISPLLSLMEDQMIALRKLNINAMMMSASTGNSHNAIVLSKMITPSSDMKILYVTPERLAKSKKFMSKLEKAYSIGNICRIVIDEIHCASNWGHDFRPDYQILGILKRQFPNLPLLGLTATASEKVLADVKDMLSLDTRCIVFRASFNRPNLFYEVYKTSADQKTLVCDIAKRIKLQFKGMSGIVYCFSRKDSEDVASGLVDQGIIAHSYHADMPADTKTKVHEGWISGRIQVVVATVAFGMGIDKPNVRFVIHFSISKSMENYYQESGRAGRDDSKSWCILYFRFQDISRQCAMVFTEKTGLENLHHMVRYCIDRQKCRRTLIGKHFGEQWNPSECKQMCDNCQRDPDVIRERSIARDASALIGILQNAAYREERLTPIKLIDLWVGKGKVKDRPKDICSLPRDECEDIVTKLLIEQILKEDFHFTPYSTVTYVLPGPRWPLLKNGRINVKMAVTCKKKDGSKRTEKMTKGLGKSNATSAKLIEVDLNESFKSEHSDHLAETKNEVKSCKEVPLESIDLVGSIIGNKRKESKQKVVLIDTDSDSETTSEPKVINNELELDTKTKKEHLNLAHSDVAVKCKKEETGSDVESVSNGKASAACSNSISTSISPSSKNTSTSDEGLNHPKKYVEKNVQSSPVKKKLSKNESDKETGEEKRKCSDSNVRKSVEKNGNSNPIKKKLSKSESGESSGEEKGKCSDSNAVTKSKKRKQVASSDSNSDSDSDSGSSLSSSESEQKTSKSSSLSGYKFKTTALMKKYGKSNDRKTTTPSSKDPKSTTNGCSETRPPVASQTITPVSSKKDKSNETDGKSAELDKTSDLKRKKRKHCIIDSDNEEDAVST